MSRDVKTLQKASPLAHRRSILAPTKRFRPRPFLKHNALKLAWGLLLCFVITSCESPNLLEAEQDSAAALDEILTDTQETASAVADPPGSTIIYLGQKGLRDGDTIDSYLKTYVKNGNEVHIPAGTYTWSGAYRGGLYGNASLVGDGEVILRTPGYRTWDTNWIARGGAFELRNITFKGVMCASSSSNAKMRVYARGTSDTVTWRNVKLPDGSCANRNGAAVFVNPEHAGKAYFIDVHLYSFVEGLYASNPGKSSGNDGQVHVVGGVYKNNNTADIRLGSTGSSARGVTIIQDASAPRTASGQLNQRGIWIRENGSGILIEDVDIIQSISKYSPLMVSPRYSGGSGTIRRVQVRTNSNEKAIYFDSAAGSWGGDDICLTGSGNLTIDRSSRFTDVQKHGCSL